MSIPQAITALLALLSAACFSMVGLMDHPAHATGLLPSASALLSMGWMFAASSMASGLFAIVHTVRSSRDTLIY
jgi:hypothetical protein